MTHKQRTYLGIIGVFLVSATVVALSKDISFLQGLAAIPLVGSLVSLLVQFLRDEAAHQRTLLLQDAQNQFILGASSHMANVAFDKHAEFSEDYVEEAQKALVTLLREGPSEEVLKHASTLYQIRNEYIVWLTPEVEDSLDPFEAALRTIGANAGYVKAIREQPGEGEARQKAINEMYNTFAKVMGFHEWQGKKLTNELAVTALVRKLRSVLGTEELTRMRGAIVKKAASGLRTEG